MGETAREIERGKLYSHNVKIILLILIDSRNNNTIYMFTAIALKNIHRLLLKFLVQRV